jgi:hypothetical protein
MHDAAPFIAMTGRRDMHPGHLSNPSIHLNSRHGRPHCGSQELGGHLGLKQQSE